MKLTLKFLIRQRNVTNFSCGCVRGCVCGRKWCAPACVCKFSHNMGACTYYITLMRWGGGVRLCYTVLYVVGGGFDFCYITLLQFFNMFHAFSIFLNIQYNKYFIIFLIYNCKFYNFKIPIFHTPLLFKIITQYIQ